MGYVCPGCQFPMEAVKEEGGAGHFRHRSFQHCDEEKALRPTAVLLIKKLG